MKRSFLLCVTVLLACSSISIAGEYEQQTVERPRRMQLPSVGGFLGVELGEVNRETVERLKLSQERGALIESVTTGSSAAQAGLQANDVVVKWDGQPIESAREMSRHIRETPAGREVRLTVVRDGREIEINVKMGERRAFTAQPRIASATPIARAEVRAEAARVREQVRAAASQVRGQGRGQGRLGVEVQSITPQLAEYFGLSKRTGALVVFVFADSPAAKAGLKAGDVILSAGGENVENPLDLRRVLNDKSEGAVEFKIVRDKQERTLTAQLEKRNRSWLLEPDDHDVVVLTDISPMVINIPQVAIAPMEIRIPRINISPRVIAVSVVSIEPMHIQMPKIQIAPMSIPSVRIEPMKVEVPRIKIAPVNIVVVPRRMWL